MNQGNTVPVVWINSSSAPFLADIGALLKRYETRSRNMLGALAYQRVILAESKSGKRLALYSVVIRSVRVVRSREEWDALRPVHRVPVGNPYDWKPETKVKYLYELSSLRRLRPFRVPDGVKHGRTWEEYNQQKKGR